MAAKLKVICGLLLMLAITLTVTGKSFKRGGWDESESYDCISDYDSDCLPPCDSCEGNCGHCDWDSSCDNCGHNSMEIIEVTDSSESDSSCEYCEYSCERC